MIFHLMNYLAFSKAIERHDNIEQVKIKWNECAQTQTQQKEATFICKLSIHSFHWCQKAQPINNRVIWECSWPWRSLGILSYSQLT